ncbi:MULTISPECIES: NAD kinase [Nitrosomonas]|uniref:NAD kinase n=1 Tax=Nitrosomonas europaea (strain ATCC 19718 / CIP 103999 / KCTC 2705 / NBRC 14298) TaxID=228410 RepID=NADK_NITEU|nr:MULTISPECIES: NAD kinase [Nitrosomonas]Q82UK6.1 RecName: Full=NAD kinase; AltName: Full=ATP-dependent NAD kinase [Nitrosomonas europaea ATCC 19718]MCE7916208.1 NAD kinase [Nitrosomonas sp. PRO5]KXK43205.1 MAG: NAD(+)/NADH kinase family protein [Nitrosomonas europaea]MBV6388581.1 NAD kinase [Nitrosomonas europaea]MEB2330712.1 NAD kinase [Nitrosomonas sp.]QOJ08530.1 MAG: NAD kinase [Nitrosomonas sp. H1_AOB3]
MDSALFKTIALIGKHKNPDIVIPLLSLAEYLTDRGISVVLDSLTAAHISNSRYPILTLEEIGKQADLAIVLGGDGTMLNIARALVPFSVPLIGINQGRLGFLTDLTADTMHETLNDMLAGQFVVENRMLLTVEVTRNGESVFKELAFNDVVLHRGISSGMIELEVHINGEYVYSLRSDGLIIATPTGSTAYALSSGGPILHPGLNLMTLVPICPHTLSNRPIVIGADATIEIKVHFTTEIKIYTDSHSWFDLSEHDRVFIQRCPETIKLLHPVHHSYYRMLREKLGWSGILQKNSR